MNTDSDTTSVEEKLLWKPKTYWLEADDEKKKKIFEFSEGYKEFLTVAKTERMAVKKIIEFAEKNGFKMFDSTPWIKHGEKIYVTNRNKNVALIVIGKEDIHDGVNLIVSHIDSPRIDLKPKPLYEDKDTGLGLFKTHYYGGIKKYQWVNIPLALYGKIIRKDGTEIDLTIGESDTEPIFVVPDLLPHLSKEQYKRELAEGIKGEELNILVGSIPVKNKKVKEKIKTSILQYLNEKYGIIEEDFASAEIEFVPAGKARDIGLDNSFVGAYGQDDKVCAYTSLRAICDINEPKRTTIVFFADKEEIGSEGVSSMKSEFLKSVIGKLLKMEEGKYDELMIRETFEKSKAISGDVNSALHPTFKDAYEVNNASRLGYGVVLTKYTGARGKALSSDASAEYIGKLRKLFNEHKVPWQVGELGKIDLGGGGTVAKYLAQYNMDVIDCGPPIMSMHSPFEISSKADVYATYLGYKVFLESCIV